MVWFMFDKNIFSNLSCGVDMAEQHVTYHMTGTVPKAFIWGTMVILPTMVDCVDEGVKYSSVRHSDSYSLYNLHERNCNKVI